MSRWLPSSFHSQEAKTVCWDWEEDQGVGHFFTEDDDSPMRRARHHKNRGFAIAKIIDDKQQSDVESKRKITDCQEDSMKKQKKKEDIAENE